MTKEEFLNNQISLTQEEYRRFGSCTKTFTILYENGTTDSFATKFCSLNNKEVFDYFMRLKCTNPETIACTFASEVWMSQTAKKKNMHPSECDDREEMVILLYSTRDNEQKMYLYKPCKDGNLELKDVDNSHYGRFCNPFLEPILTKPEKENAIDKFQKYIRDSICDFFQEYGYLKPLLCFLTDKAGEVIVRQIPDDEWSDQNGLVKQISSTCQDPRIIAFILAFPENDKVKMILVSAEVETLYSYRIDSDTNTINLESVEVYTGALSGIIKCHKILFGIPRRNLSL